MLFPSEIVEIDQAKSIDMWREYIGIDAMLLYI